MRQSREDTIKAYIKSLKNTAFLFGADIDTALRKADVTRLPDINNKMATITETEIKFAEFVRSFCKDKDITLTPEKLDGEKSYEWWQIYDGYGNRIATHTFRFDDMGKEEAEYYQKDIALFIIATNMADVIKKIIIPNI